MLCLDSFLLLSCVISLWPREEGYKWRGFLRLWLSWADACFTGHEDPEPQHPPRWEMLVWCHMLITQCREWRWEDPGQCWPALPACLGTLDQWDTLSQNKGDSCSWGMTYQAVLWLSHVMLGAHVCMLAPTEFPFCTSASASSGSPGNGCIYKLQSYCHSPHSVQALLCYFKICF